MNFLASINAWAGGYAAFIVPAYGVTVLGLLGAIVWTWKAYGEAKARVRALEEKTA